MRDILFRGKSCDIGEWVEGFYQEYPEGYVHIQNVYNDWYPVYPKTVGQFTGLYDKNGKKIFEGDVVKTKFGRLCIVEWFSTRAHCGWDLKPVDTVDNILRTEPPTEYDMWENTNLEVVGNIYDNPELAEAKWYER